MKLLDHQDILPFEMKLLAADGVSLGHFSDNINLNPSLQKAKGKSLKPTQRLYTQNVKIIARDNNGNLKALTFVILKIIYEKNNNIELLQQIKCTLYSNDADLYSIFKKPERDLSNLVMKKILVQFFQLLRYGNYENKVQNKTLKYPIVIQFFTLFLRAILKSLSVQGADNYQKKIETKKVIPLLCQYFDISCRVFDGLYLFFEDGMFISSHDDQQFCIGNFSENKIQSKKPTLQQNQIVGLEQNDSESDSLNFGQTFSRDKPQRKLNIKQNSNESSPRNRKYSDVESSQRQTPSFPDFQADKVKIQRRKKSFGGQNLSYQKLQKFGAVNPFKQNDRSQNLQFIWHKKDVQSKSGDNSQNLKDFGQNHCYLSQSKKKFQKNQIIYNSQDNGVQTPGFSNSFQGINQKTRKYTLQQNSTNALQHDTLLGTPCFNNSFVFIQSRNFQKQINPLKIQSHLNSTSSPIRSAQQKLEESTSTYLGNSYNNRYELKNEGIQIFSDKPINNTVNQQKFLNKKQLDQGQNEKIILQRLQNKQIMNLEFKNIQQIKPKKWYPFTQRQAQQRARIRTDQYYQFKDDSYCPALVSKNSVESCQINSSNKNKIRQNSKSCYTCIENGKRFQNHQLKSKIIDVTYYPDFKKKQDKPNVIYFDSEKNKQLQYSLKNKNMSPLFISNSNKYSINQQSQNFQNFKYENINKSTIDYQNKSLNISSNSSSFNFQSNSSTQNSNNARNQIYQLIVNSNYTNSLFKNNNSNQNTQIYLKKYQPFQSYQKTSYQNNYKNPQVNQHQGYANSHYNLPFHNNLSYNLQNKSNMYNSHQPNYNLNQYYQNSFNFNQQSHYYQNNNNPIDKIQTFKNKMVASISPKVSNVNKTMPINLGNRIFLNNNIEKCHSISSNKPTFSLSKSNNNYRNNKSALMQQSLFLKSGNYQFNQK